MIKDYNVTIRKGRTNVSLQLSDIRAGDKFKFKDNGTSKYLVAREDAHIDWAKGEYVCIVEKVEE